MLTVLAPNPLYLLKKRFWEPIHDSKRCGIYTYTLQVAFYGPQT